MNTAQHTHYMSPSNSYMPTFSTHAPSLYDWVLGKTRIWSVVEDEDGDLEIRSDEWGEENSSSSGSSLQLHSARYSLVAIKE